MLSQYNKDHSGMLFIQIEITCPLFECIVSDTSADITVFIKLLNFSKPQIKLCPLFPSQVGFQSITKCLKSYKSICCFPREVHHVVGKGEFGIGFQSGLEHS
jgi:hypothetical protein